MEYAKFWVGMVGVVLASVLASWPEAPRWVFIASAVATAVGVYLTPNKNYEGAHEKGWE